VGFSVFGACIPDLVKDSESESPFFESEQFELIWSALQQDKKRLLSQTISLTTQEAATFWPLFETFQNDMKKITSDFFNHLGVYAAKYYEMSDDEAGAMLKKYLDLEEQRIALKKSYIERFSKILAQKKMLRYFQLENKIEAAIRHAIAINIPVIE